MLPGWGQITQLILLAPLVLALRDSRGTAPQKQLQRPRPPGKTPRGPGSGVPARRAFQS